MAFYHSFLVSFLMLLFITGNAGNSKLFREYIGAESDSIKLSDVPINSKVEFHFILAFAIDYTSNQNPSPTNGIFKAFWENKHLNPAEISRLKGRNSNIKAAVSLGGDTVGNESAYFAPKSINSWVQNAVSSLTKMIKEYSFDGIDIDYEHFKEDPDTFAECIGQLVMNLKKNRIISFASIAPYDDEPVKSHYLELWRRYGHFIDYVNFQFYAYDKIGVNEFIRFYNQQASNYGGGQILASFAIDEGQGLGPDDGFFEACKELTGQKKLGGIFVWCADESLKHDFIYEQKAQNLLASSS